MKLIFKTSLLVLFIIVGNTINSQNAIGVQLNKDLFKTGKEYYFSLPVILSIFNSQFYHFKSSSDATSKQIDLSEIAFDCNDLATFCRLELKLEKATKFPIKFRLGEVQYVERMEGKY